jgi:hypothetical protein
MRIEDANLIKLDNAIEKTKALTEKQAEIMKQFNSLIRLMRSIITTKDLKIRSLELTIKNMLKEKGN